MTTFVFKWFVFSVLCASSYAKDPIALFVEVANQNTPSPAQLKWNPDGSAEIVQTDTGQSFSVDSATASAITRLSEAPDGKYFRVGRNNGGYSGANLVRGKERIRVVQYRSDGGKSVRVKVGFRIADGLGAFEDKYSLVDVNQPLTEFDPQVLRRVRSVAQFGRATQVATFVQQVGPLGIAEMIPLYHLDHPPGSEVGKKPDILIRKFKLPISTFVLGLNDEVYQQARGQDPSDLETTSSIGNLAIFGYIDPYGKQPTAHLRGTTVLKGNVRNARVAQQLLDLCGEAFIQANAKQ